MNDQSVGESYLKIIDRALMVFALLTISLSVSAASTTNERLLNSSSEPQNWLHHHGSYSSQRFANLKEINRTNVAKLKVAWTYALGGTTGGGIWPIAGLESTPLVEDGFMYAVDGWGVVTKIDVHGGRSKFVWRMDPATDKDWAGEIACCGVDNKGVALWENQVLSHTLDGRLIATNKDDGEIIWEAELADPAIGETITVAPLIAKDMAISGVSGGEFGIRGWIEATDLKTGKRRWRQHTIPAPDEPGSDTWKDDHEAYKTGGGATWVTGSYDAKLDLIYWGVGNPGPDWDREYRPGDNLYSNSAIALDPSSGAIKFHFQYTPNDPFDYDGVNELVLADTEIAGREISLMLHADRNGFLYALDRTNGSFVYATSFVKELNWTAGIHPTTGRPIDYNPESNIQNYAGVASSRSKPKSGLLCPAAMGGKNWTPMSYNPARAMLYIPVIESCHEITTTEVAAGGTRVPREWFTAGGIRQTQRITGSLTAIDVKTGKVAFKAESEWPLLGGVLATAGDLVFAGLPNGDVVAYDAENLTELWRFPTGSGINAPVMSYAVDGKQFVAIAVGFGGTMPKWWIDAVPGLENTNPSSMIFSFALD
ncbi:MAG: PQQ-dependent dehydrogenase, methanol/ethanol family [Proteobacteria bacterium]|nr:PQQ-dependent dehydrogenase, methanol/ethanol family [Pseudomonadota bacterium]